MPWNFPFWQVFRFAAPAVMAGNAVVLKHASVCTGAGLAIEEIFREAGFPEHLFRSLVVSGAGVPAAMEHDKVRGVTLTGSEETGRAVAARAGGLLRKIVLELGGSDPYLILEDQDDRSLDHAAETCVQARMLVSGQVCISAKRLIAVDAVREDFTRLVLEKLRNCRCGDPMREETDLGPLARGDLRDRVHRQVRESVARGARLLLGGQPVQGPGFYYPPTLLADVREGMPAYEEEVFGPVAAVLPARDEAEAIRIANDTRFGLGAAVFTRDTARGEAIAADELEAGICAVNSAVFSDPRLPFGGVKASGHGRELSEEGIREFLNVKTVVVRE
jgi:succinate-semialdehyde dehydrogenase/glutarate-semialdehyde dehydrogenase